MLNIPTEILASTFHLLKSQHSMLNAKNYYREWRNLRTSLKEIWNLVLVNFHKRASGCKNRGFSLNNAVSLQTRQQTETTSLTSVERLEGQTMYQGCRCQSWSEDSAIHTNLRLWGLSHIGDQQAYFQSFIMNAIKLYTILNFALMKISQQCEYFKMLCLFTLI